MSMISQSGRSRGGGARNVILLILGMAVLFAAGFGLSWLLRGGASDSASPTSTSSGPTPGPCVTVTVVPGAGLPKPGAVTVNVYNATDRAGLARGTAGELTQRGFTVGKIANDPLAKTITGVAEIRYGTKGAGGAKLLRVYVPGATVVSDARTDATVDLVLGAKFATVATTAQAQAALTKPVPSASGAGCVTAKPAPKPSATVPPGTTPAPSPS